jgi:hypothetical protein
MFANAPTGFGFESSMDLASVRHGEIHGRLSVSEHGFTAELSIDCAVVAFLSTNWSETS